jgi:hypothetical protein
MKKIKVIVSLLLIINVLYADTNTTITSLDVIDKLGGVFEGMATKHTGQLANIVSLFIAFTGIIMTIITVFLAYKITKNSDKIDEIKKEMDKNLNELRKELKQEIKEEVMQQIVYIADKDVQRIQQHAYNRIEHTIDKMTENTQTQRFVYQKIIYKINQMKKYEYETIMMDSALSTDEKLNKIIIVQSKYNEVNNQSIPKIFSKNMEEKVIPASIKLSEIKKIHHIIIEELEKKLNDDTLSFIDKESIKEVLITYYNWKEKELKVKN